MKIAVVDNLPEGGAKRVVFEQIKGLSEFYEIDYYTNTLKSRFDFKKYCNIYRFNLELDDFKGLLRPIKEFSLFRLSRNYKKIAKAINSSNAEFSIVHPCQVTQAPFVLCWLKRPNIYFIEEVLRVAHEPELFSVDDLHGLNKYYEKLRRKLVAKIDKENVKTAKQLICTSNFVQRQVKRIYKRNSTVFSLGVDTDVFKPMGRKGKKLLFVGEKDSINSYGLVNGLEDKIEFIEFKKQSFKFSDRQMAKKYSSAAAVLCLGRREPFGLVALETMACNTPVIALDEGGYRETVKNHGILIRPNKSELNKAIRRIQNCKNTRNYVIKNYNWKTHISKLVNIINKNIINKNESTKVKLSKVKLSIIIVDFEAKEELIKCLASIKMKLSWEIIVIDNNKVNRGFAKGCNLGARQAKGEYLLFLNPDIKVRRRAIETLLKKLESNNSIGIIGPQLINKHGKAYLSFTQQPNWFSFPIVYSFINTIWPNNKVSYKFWFKGKPLGKARFVGEVSGACMMMKKIDFDNWSGFDERFFLYWEDIDLCKKAINSGRQVLYYPQAKMIHIGGISSKQVDQQALKWFKQSRYRFLNKHFGIVYALFCEVFLRTGELVRQITKKRVVFR